MMTFRFLAAAALVWSATTLAHAEDLTELSKKAAAIPDHAVRNDVVRLLGPATWAVLGSDQGDFSTSGPALYILYWRNTPCAPVSVSFGEGGKVLGIDEGRGVCGQNVIDLQLEPGQERSCALPDRARLCG